MKGSSFGMRKLILGFMSGLWLRCGQLKRVLRSAAVLNMMGLFVSLMGAEQFIGTLMMKVRQALPLVSC